MVVHKRAGGFVASIVLTGLSQNVSGQAARRPAIIVLVYDYAGVSADTMRRASESVIRIYRDTGVDIEWIDPLVDRRYSMINPTSNSLRIFAVQIMIRPRKPSSGPPSAPSSVMATTPAAGESGGTLSVFYDQVARVARRYKHPLDDILAVAIAHEMGHVLLPYPAHSTTGIMRAEWDGDDLRHLASESLRFTPSQASPIRSKLTSCCGWDSGTLGREKP